jgi:pimeloyl-ACP methyl ester carboxylesterase
MNNKNALKVEEWRQQQLSKGIDMEAAAAGWQLALFGLVLSLVDLIFNQRWLLTLILERFATAENVRAALEGSVYLRRDRVTDDLVDDYLSLASDRAAAVEVLRQIYTNDGGPLPFPAVEALPDSFPILAVWGDRDNLAPMTGPVGKYFRARSQQLERCRFEEIAAGHVPQDDDPGLTNRILTEWLATI